MKENAQLQNKLESLEQERLQLKEKSGSITWKIVLIPLVIFFLAIGLSFPTPILIFSTFFAAMVSVLIYQGVVITPYKEVKARFKEALITEFIAKYHPGITISYTPGKKNVSQILRESDLMRADKYFEEDVLEGKFNQTNFYLSEIRLEDEDDNNTTTKFKGLLFKIRKEGSSFPKTRIQSRIGLLSQWFGSYQKNEEFDFYFDTENVDEFNKRFGDLFPFIRHLKSKSNNLRMFIDGDEITMMLQSDMKFLDEPPMGVSNTLLNPKYYESLGKQINSLLFIVESLENNVGRKEIEERLELKMLEKIELRKE